MNVQNLFFTNGRLKTIWRILTFICLLTISVAPLVFIDNSYLQFLGASLILVYGLYLNSKYLDQRNFSEYGLVLKKETFIYLLVGIIIGLLSVILVFFIGKATGSIFVSRLTTNPDFQQSFLFASKMLLVAFLEETLFRGYLFTNIYDGFKSKTITHIQTSLIALILSSVLFGLAHIGTNNTSILSVLFLSINGMVWCVPFLMTKNIGLSIGLHMAWNFAQTQIGFTMSGNKAFASFFKIENIGSDLLTGGAYGPEAGILGLVGFITMLLLSLLYLKFKHPIGT